MSTEHVQARTGTYADSVTLMQVSAKAQAVAGVQVALVAMGTELNLGMLSSLGFAPPTVTRPSGGAREPASAAQRAETAQPAEGGQLAETAQPAGAGPPTELGANDLLIAIRADDDDSLAAALAAVDAALAARPDDHAGQAADQPPRTVLSAARRSGPALALISVPGQYAFAEAMDALDADCDVMIFSDNVPVEQEIALKDIAAQRGLLVMGPDCGTAIVAGIGLGFSHSVPPGPIGLVAASGTGAQQVVCLLDTAGVGVSAVLGVGGRDLSAAVGGRSARAALAALDVDPATKLIVLLSKPPASEVAAELRAFASVLATPVQFAMIGPDQPDLTAAAEAALRTIGQPVPDWPRWPAAGAGPGNPAGQAGEDQPPLVAADELGAVYSASHGIGADPDGSDAGHRQAIGALRGLFAGGTLCDEAMVIAARRLGEIRSNIPLRPSWLLDPRSPAAGHAMIDFGDDELTAGRPHPMIDQTLRLDRLAAVAADPATAVILLDVVLGHGAHPDPAAELGPAIAAALASRHMRFSQDAHANPPGLTQPGTRDLAVVVSLIGASTDPQGLVGQALALQQAGAHVFASNAQAARFACDLIDGVRPETGDQPGPGGLQQTGSGS